MKLSIIVPLYNADFFEFQIETLKKQTCSVGDFEIVYIDDGSDKNYQDFYKEVLEKSGLNYQYYYLDDKKGRARISEARNLGVVKSQSDDLVFIDADCLLPDYYISHLIQIVQDTSEPVIL